MTILKISLNGVFLTDATPQVLWLSLHETRPYSEFFCSVFSRHWTEKLRIQTLSMQCIALAKSYNDFSKSIILQFNELLLNCYFLIIILLKFGD